MKLLASFLILSVIALPLTGCSSSGEDRSMKSHPTTLGTDTPPNLKLTLAWNHETFEVPAPAGVPPEMRATKDYAHWWKIGNVRPISWTDPQGRTYVADAWGTAIDRDGTRGPIIPFVYRYRPDGTLEMKSSTVPTPKGGFTTWTVYAPDGKTPVLTAHCHDPFHGEPAYVESVEFFDPTGVKKSEYEANQYGVVYREMLYRPDGVIAKTNGSSKLNKPL